jgi:hypothetical protein
MRSMIARKDKLPAPLRHGETFRIAAEPRETLGQRRSSHRQQ